MNSVRFVRKALMVAMRLRGGLDTSVFAQEAGAAGGDRGAPPASAPRSGSA